MANATAVLIGRLGKDPEKKLVGDTKLVEFSVAVDAYRKREQATDWFDVTAFGATAEHVGKHFKKGSLAVVVGDLVVDKWEKDGEKRSRVRVIATSVSFGPSSKSGSSDGSGGAQSSESSGGDETDW